MGFSLFGAAHFVTLGLIATVAVGAARRARDDLGFRERGRHVVATALFVAGVGFVVIERVVGTSWSYVAPLHLCDLSVFVGSFALWRRHHRAAEVCYFWGLAGAVPALLTPDLQEGFPHFRFLFYFAQHGLIVVAAAFVSGGLGLAPRPRSWLAAWGWLQGAGLLVAGIDLGTGTNFLYLRAPPPSPTPVDWFGPWPYYVVVVDLLGLLLFYLLAWPWRARERAAPGPSPAN